MTKSLEDYIEAIHLHIKAEGSARVVDIANSLGVKMPSVNNAVKELAKLGLISYEPYHSITLTDEGRRQAEEIFRRHTILKDFLLSIGVSAENAERDACSMEHVLSAETLAKLRRMTLSGGNSVSAAGADASAPSSPSPSPALPSSSQPPPPLFCQPSRNAPKRAAPAKSTR